MRVIWVTGGVKCGLKGPAGKYSMLVGNFILGKLWTTSVMETGGAVLCSVIFCCSEFWANVHRDQYAENLVISLYVAYVNLQLNIYIYHYCSLPPVPTTFLVFVLVLSCSAHWVDTPTPSEPGKRKLWSCIWIPLFSRWTLHALSKTWD